MPVTAWPVQQKVKNNIAEPAIDIVVFRQVLRAGPVDNNHNFPGGKGLLNY